MKLLLIDNYDSFTYNIVHAFAKVGCKEATVIRNNQLSTSECLSLNPTHIVVGPGPDHPQTAGLSIELIKAAPKNIPILGICLGHQCIAEAFGGKTIRAKLPVHGKASLIYHNNQGLFCGTKSPFRATRYHSLITCRKTLPKSVEVTATTEEKEIMGIRHKTLPIEGVQFHPESILSENCEKLLQNFLENSHQNRCVLPFHFAKALQKSPKQELAHSLPNNFD